MTLTQVGASLGIFCAILSNPTISCCYIFLYGYFKSGKKYADFSHCF